jgi:PQQ-like domain
MPGMPRTPSAVETGVGRTRHLALRFGMTLSIGRRSANYSSAGSMLTVSQISGNAKHLHTLLHQAQAHPSIGAAGGFFYGARTWTIYRGAALWGNFVISMANYPPRMIATDKETGKVVWETNLSDGQATLQFSAAPLAVKDKIILGAAGGDRGVRDFIVALDAATGQLAWRKYVIPAPGEPGSETWKDKNNAWLTGGGAMWVTGSYDVDTNQVLWGTGNPVPMFNPYYRPGNNLYTNSLISWDPDSGKMNWYFQYRRHVGVRARAGRGRRNRRSRRSRWSGA